MAAKADLYHNAIDLAAATGLPSPTVSKLLAAMARAGVLVSHRGAKGGYRLARQAEDITAADIVCAVDGPIALTVCIEHGAGACDVEALCPTRGGWHRINNAVRRAMQGVSLAELAFPAMADTVEVSNLPSGGTTQTDNPAQS
jgi:Rrf2 family protein